MATIDSLDIQITSNFKSLNVSLATTAKHLSSLSSSLAKLNGTGLSSFASGINDLSVAASRLGSINSDKISALSSSLNKLANAKYSNLNTASASVTSFVSMMRQLNVGTIGSVATSLGELGNAIGMFGRQSAQAATANIPQLTNAFMQMMRELAKAPVVSRNVIDLANSMASLLNAARGSHTPITRTSKALNIFGVSAHSANKRAKNLASSIGMLYAKFWIFLRVGQKAWQSIKKGMDYIEIVNYMNAAFEQVAAKADYSAFEKLGYDSAEAYASSFYETASDLTQAMSGFKATSAGLASTGGTTLGVNPNVLMKYQAQFAQLSSSMGVSSAYASKLSVALTEIGADLASVKNYDFSYVFDNLSSGLVGMARSIDKYGANIRSTNQQQRLANLGIQTNIQNLNQNEKALLRVMEVIDSTRYAWTDLARTLDQPANQLRMLKSNLNALATTMGQIFLPIVTKVIPYINMLVVALQRLFEYIRNIFGIEWIDIGKEGFSDLMSDVLDEADSMSDALDDSAKSAKKLKSQLIGIDELNVMSEDTGKGKGATGLSAEDMGLLEAALDEMLDEYQKRWDEAYAKIEQHYAKFADQVQKSFEEGGFAGVGTYFSNLITNALNGTNWDDIKSYCRTFAENVAKFLNGFINPEMFSGIGKSIAETLNTLVETAYSFATTFDWENLGESTADGANKFLDAFDGKKFSKTINAFADGIWKALKTAVKKFHWGDLFAEIRDTLSLDVGTVALIIAGFTFKHMGQIVSAIGLRTLAANAIKKAFATNVGLSAGLPTFAVQVAIVLTVAKVSFETGKALGELLDPESKEYYENFKWFGEGGFFDTVLPANPFKDINGFIEDIKINFNAFKMMLEDFGDNDAVTVGISGILGPLSAIPLTIDNVKDSFEKAFGENGVVPNVLFDFGTKVDDEFGEGGEVPRTIGGFISYVKEKYGGIVPFMATVWLNINERFSKPFEAVFGENGVLPTAIGKFKAKVEEDFGGIPGFLRYVWGVIQKSFFDEFIKKIDEFKDKSTKTFGDIKEKIGNVIDNIKTILSGLNAFIDGVFSSDWQSAWNGVKEVFKGVWNAIANILEGSVNAMIDGINFFTSDFRKIANGIADATGKEFHISEIQHISIQKYAMGGIPDTGSLFIANEAGPEMVGRFGSHTGVANNDQIVRGITEGVRDAVITDLVPMISQIVTNTGETASKDFSVSIGDREIAKANNRGARQLGMTIITES